MSFTGAEFNQYLAEHKLMGTRCASCGALHLPPPPICTTCHSDDMGWTEFSGRGQLLAFTTVHIAPTAMIEAGYGRDKPYCTGIVQLEEGPDRKKRTYLAFETKCRLLGSSNVQTRPV